MLPVGELLKPINPLPVRASSPFAPRLQLAVPFTHLDFGNSTQALVRDYGPYRRHGTIAGVANGYGRRGPVRQHTATADKVDFGPGDWLPTRGVTIILGYRKRDATSRSACAFGYNDAAFATFCGVLLPFTDGRVYWDFGGNTAGTSRLSTTSTTLVSAANENIWAFTTGPRGMEIWRDGIKVAANSANPTRTTGTASFKLGIHDAGNLTSDLADYTALLVYDCQLDESMVRLLSADPFLPFRGEPEDWGPAVAPGAGPSIPVLMDSYRRRRAG